MLVRLIVGGTLALALVAAQGAGAAGSAEARMLKGRTGQGHKIKVLAKPRRFRIHTFNIDLKCRDGSRVLLEEGGFLWTQEKPNGSFRDSQFGDTDSIYFRGHVNGRSIRGRIRVTDKEKRGPMCSSRWIPFHAG